MKVGDKVVSKELPGLGTMTVHYVSSDIVTVSISEDAKDEDGTPFWNAGGLDDADYDDLVVVS